nr:hypothetical protein [Cytophagales bacterium]
MQKKLLESRTWINELKEKGSGFLQAGAGEPMKWTLLSTYRDQGDSGVCLLYDLYQLRTIAPPFSDVSLDIVDWTEEPVIFHTPVSPLLVHGPISKGIIKFVLVKEAFWNRMLYSIGQILVTESGNEGQNGLQIDQNFPYQGKNVKEIYLTAEGHVKIIKP